MFIIRFSRSELFSDSLLQPLTSPCTGSRTTVEILCFIIYQRGLIIHCVVVECGSARGYKYTAAAVGLLMKNPSASRSCRGVERLNACSVPRPHAVLLMIDRSAQLTKDDATQKSLRDISTSVCPSVWKKLNLSICVRIPFLKYFIC